MKSSFHQDLKHKAASERDAVMGGDVIQPAGDFEVVEVPHDL
ncbi:hypothetical protein [Thalassoglobus sp.]